MVLYVEKLAVMNQVTGSAWPTLVYDRDQSGTAIDQHWADTGTGGIGFGQLSVDNVHPLLKNCAIQTPKGEGTNSCTVSGNAPAASQGGPSDSFGADSNMSWQFAPPLDATREDGYFDGSLAIQGVRAYDPNMNQWTTPDAYSGDVHDPMSTHPYMWNDNNPVQYGDPSGYHIDVEGTTGFKAYVAALVADIKSQTFAAWYKEVNDSPTKFVITEAQTPGESHFGQMQNGSWSIMLDTSLTKAKIKGEVVHETDHARHVVESASAYGTRVGTLLHCSCDQTLEPANQEELLTFFESLKVTEEDSGVSWLGPTWGKGESTWSQQQVLDQMQKEAQSENLNGLTESISNWDPQ